MTPTQFVALVSRMDSNSHDPEEAIESLIDMARRIDPPKPSQGCYALLIDNEQSAEIYLFDTEAERESFLWDYAFDNSGTDSETLDEFKAEHGNDLGSAMDATNDGWQTAETIWKRTAAEEAAPAMPETCRDALAFIEEEAENRAEAGSTYSDYEREPRELAERLEAVIASTALSSADSAASSTASTCGR